MNIVLYGNGAAGNHGCEAIVRGTVALLGEQNRYTVVSENPEQDSMYGLASFAEIISAKTGYKHNAEFLKAYLNLKLTGNYTEMDGLAYMPGIRALKGKVDVALSVGGDNYCYSGTGLYAYLNKAYRKQGIKTVLWGCSIEPEAVDRAEIAKDLAGYNAIITRESITFEAVKKVQKNTYLMPDPAFYMKPIECEIDPRFESGNVIGINISPMIISNETADGMAYQNYKKLVEWILDNTDSKIALIPHVVWETNDDREVLKRMYDDFGQNERLILVQDHSAPELKYIISKCSFFVGARTHATIAAYSSCVPTLVVGYSVKARGIAKDLFGTEENYVLPVQNLNQPDQLKSAFVYLWEKRDEISAHLKDFLPGYTSLEGRKIEEIIR